MRNRRRPRPIPLGMKVTGAFITDTFQTQLWLFALARAPAAVVAWLDTIPSSYAPRLRA
jgi:hypothetical protein